MVRRPRRDAPLILCLDLSVERLAILRMTCVSSQVHRAGRACRGVAVGDWDGSLPGCWRKTRMLKSR